MDNLLSKLLSLMTKALFSSFTVNQVRIQRFMEKTKKKNASSNDPDGRSESVTNEQEKLRKKVILLMKKQKLQQVRQIVKGQDNLKPWGQDAHAKVSLVYNGFKWKSPGSLLLLLINHYRIFSVCC